MNLYELFSLFWRDNGYRAFSKTETILYFYLLNMANSARWQMPFTGYTERISADLQTTKQNSKGQGRTPAARSDFIHSRDWKGESAFIYHN